MDPVDCTQHVREGQAASVQCGDRTLRRSLVAVGASGCENAVSVAGLLLTTEAVVAEKSKASGSSTDLGHSEDF